ncbi:hypothetical protein Hamer_G021683, partial [Homarus americanus]
ISSYSKQYVAMSDKELINDMIVPLLHQWTKANALFKPPVINQCRTIELKLTKLWHKAVETSLGKGNLARKNEFLHTLDTLFDILTCKCSIQLCSESNCSHSGKRENNSHIDCGCPREKKIPVLELEFIKAQRTKAEGQGSMQMGSIDYSETKKQIANAKKREQIREREQKKKMKSEEAIQREEELCQDVYHFFDIPPINVNATKLSELVDLSLEVLEPPLTTSLTSQELRNLKETPMQVPKWPSHTQSVERCVKMVTEAAGHVYSHERREDRGGQRDGGRADGGREDGGRRTEGTGGRRTGDGGTETEGRRTKGGRAKGGEGGRTGRRRDGQTEDGQTEGRADGDADGGTGRRRTAKGETVDRGTGRRRRQTEGRRTEGHKDFKTGQTNMAALSCGDIKALPHAAKPTLMRRMQSQCQKFSCSKRSKIRMRDDKLGGRETLFVFQLRLR